MVVAGRSELVPTPTKDGKAWHLRLLPLHHLGKEAGGRRERSVPVKAEYMRALWWSSQVVLVLLVPVSVA